MLAVCVNGSSDRSINIQAAVSEEFSQDEESMIGSPFLQSKEEVNRLLSNHNSHENKRDKWHRYQESGEYEQERGPDEDQ